MSLCLDELNYQFYSSILPHQLFQSPNVYTTYTHSINISTVPPSASRWKFMFYCSHKSYIIAWGHCLPGHQACGFPPKPPVLLWPVFLPCTLIYSWWLKSWWRRLLAPSVMEQVSWGHTLLRFRGGASLLISLGRSVLVPAWCLHGTGQPHGGCCNSVSLPQPNAHFLCSSHGWPAFHTASLTHLSDRQHWVTLGCDGCFRWWFVGVVVGWQVNDGPVVITLPEIPGLDTDRPTELWVSTLGLKKHGVQMSSFGPLWATLYWRVFNTMATDDLAMQGARTLVAMVLNLDQRFTINIMTADVVVTEADGALLDTQRTLHPVGDKPLSEPMLTYCYC